MTDNRPRILIADDFDLIRGLLRVWCSDKLGYNVVAEATTGTEAIVMSCQMKPDLLLLDLEFPDINGMTVVEMLGRLHQLPKTLVLSGFCNDGTIAQVRDLPVNGFVSKSECSVELLKDAIRCVLDGGHYFSASFKALQSTQRKDPNAFCKILSPHQQTILAMIGDAMTNEEIAGRLAIKVETVEKHRVNLARKLNMRGRGFLEKFARASGLTLKMLRTPPGELLDADRRLA